MDLKDFEKLDYNDRLKVLYEKVFEGKSPEKKLKKDTKPK